MRGKIDLFCPKFKPFADKRLIYELPRSCLVKVLLFRGRVQATSSHGKTYVKIYIYREFGGEELVKHIGKEVEGLLVIKDESP